MSKYAPLAKHLQGLEQDRWTASFTEIETILGCPLPASAKQYPAWWANQTGGGHSQSLSWQSVGWQTSEPNFTRQTIKFVRASSGVSKPSPACAGTLEDGDHGVAERPPTTSPSQLKLSIEQAKTGLSAFYGVAPENIEITIRG